MLGLRPSVEKVGELLEVIFGFCSCVGGPGKWKAMLNERNDVDV